jgi:hypothetical protein
MLKTRLAILAALLAAAAWHQIETDIRAACGDSQACLAASL